MIASFFQRLEEHHVEWLLVSGQATILYGAATFSEDVDLWVEPGEENLHRLERALSAAGARYYKLTPPLTAEFAARHHGFHFTVPNPDGGVAMYLDVMGRPPRVGPFQEAAQRARAFETQWGTMNTVAIPDLVELKKTQRPQDYPIISRLVLAHLREIGETCSTEDFRWAVSNMFSLPEFKQLLEEHPGIHQMLPADPLAESAAEQLTNGLPLSADLEDELADWLDARIAPLRKADRRFWRPVIDELRELRKNDALMQEGLRV